MPTKSAAAGPGTRLSVLGPPAARRRGRRRPAPAARAPIAAPSLPALLFALLLILAWIAIYPRTPDMAAQVYRVGLFSREGFAVWDGNWYAGHHLPGYSLISPPLGSLIGIRLMGGAAALTSCVIFDRLAVSAYGSGAGWGSALFAIAAVGDLWTGRVTFALGVALGLAALFLLLRGANRSAALLALLCALASPVAGALLALAGLTLALAEASPQPFAALGVPALAAVGALAALFPEGGTEPYPITSFAATAAVAVGLLVALPRSERTARIGAALYLAVCVLCLLVHTPVGSNAERYGVLLAGPVLLCACMRGGSRRARISPAAAVVVVAATLWILWGPVRETAAVAGSPATSASYYTPVERFVASLGEPVRIEVPLTRSHWEAALLAPAVPLARGWEKQLDERYDRVLLSRGLTAASYRAWLDEQAVSYVALPDAALDPSSAAEGRLIRGGLPFLSLVSSPAHWRIYRVQGAAPIAAGPGTLTALGHDSFTLRAAGAGSFLVRVHYTRYWSVTAGAACVRRAPGGWTQVTVPRPGPVTVAARFSLEAAFGLAGACASA